MSILLKGDKCNLDILDICKPEPYWGPHGDFMNTGHCFMLIFSVTDRGSFSKVNELHNYIKKNRKEEILPTVLVGNKIDLVDEREVTVWEGPALANQLKIPYVETSAKTGANVSTAFEILINNTPTLPQLIPDTRTEYDVVVVGDTGVGKSSLIEQFVSIDEHYTLTVMDSHFKFKEIPK